MISYSNIKKNFYKSLNKILNDNINILLKYNQPIKSMGFAPRSGGFAFGLTPKIHYVDFKKLEKYKKSNQNHHKI